MADSPTKKNFGKRRPPAEPPPPRPPVKRSGEVALLVMGTIAVGATAFTLLPRQTCDPAAPGTPAQVQPDTTCSSGSSSHGGHWSSRSSFFSGDDSSHSSSADSSSSHSSGVTRGGFGSFAHGLFAGGG